MAAVLLSRVARVSAVAFVLLATACARPGSTPGGASAPAPSVSPAPAPVTASATVPGVTGSPSATTGCDSAAWRTAPYTVTHHPTVPPVPTTTAIRTATHPECRYDRIVFDITGPTPTYQIRYITHPTTDPADQPITIPGDGTTYLQITLHPAQAHTTNGTPTTPRSATLAYPMLKGYTITGDNEGYLTITLGLATTTGIRTGELTGRIYLDIAHG